MHPAVTEPGSRSGGREVAVVAVLAGDPAVPDLKDGHDPGAGLKSAQQAKDAVQWVGEVIERE